MSGADNMADVVKNMTINSGSDLNTDVSTRRRSVRRSSTCAAWASARRWCCSTAAAWSYERRGTRPTAATSSTSTPSRSTSIERIEVLKGGASAIYGSDAVAGVVNIITRKHMDGFEAQVGGQTTDDFDHHEWEVSLIGGAEGENTRVMGAVSYFKREPLMAEDRDFTKNGRNISTLGWPSAYLGSTR